MSLVALTTTEPDLEQKCQQLAEKYSVAYLPHYEMNQSLAAESPKYFLELSSEQLSLVNVLNTKLKPFCIDFCQGKIAYRGARANTELLGKAIGIKKLNHPKVLDATAGLGRDGFLLANLGCEVIMLEKNPVLFLLLSDALERYQQSALPPLNLKLFHQDAIEFLKLSKPTPVIYLDPMFPERNKSALVKKEMQFLHDIIGPSENDQELLELSLQTAEKRVVVKRPLHAEYLANKNPSFSYKGKAVRFDIYTTV